MEIMSVFNESMQQLGTNDPLAFERTLMKVRTAITYSPSTKTFVLSERGLMRFIINPCVLMILPKINQTNIKLLSGHLGGIYGSTSMIIRKLD